MLLYKQSRKFCSSKKVNKLLEVSKQTIKEIQEKGLFKREKQLQSPQSSSIVVNNKRLLNFCANNYLGLSNNPEIIANCTKVLKERGYGMSSVRFICGTQDVHKELEAKLCSFHKTEDAILYSSCFDANTGFFETVLNEQDAIISDTLNHASIIDGVRLCKAKKFRYKHIDMEDLEEKLKEASEQRVKLIVSDGVFSMDGDIAPLDKIVALAEKYNANIFIDDSHGIGAIGKTGGGVCELYNNYNIDILTSTMGKALGGGSGGYTTGKKEIIEVLRQRSRPYLFSNSILPLIASGTTQILTMLEKDNSLVTKLNKNTVYFRQNIKKLGYTILGNDICPIVPILLKDDRLAIEFGVEMIEKYGIYVVGFVFPVVPLGQSRIRVQISAAHSTEDLDFAIEKFRQIGKEKKII